MSLDYINEAFKSLESLNEDIFSTDRVSLNELSDFISSDVDTEDEKISIIDMDAETEEDLQDNYIGKIICDCNVCHSHVFKDKDAITINDDGVVDIEDDCPYCAERNGFVIIGEITEFNPAAKDEITEVSTDAEEVAEIEKPVEEAEEVEESSEIVEEVLDEALNEAPRKFKPHTIKLLKMIGSDLVKDIDESVDEPLDEALKNVSIETDDQKMVMTSEDSGKVTITAEPLDAELVTETADEVITPIATETQDEIITASTQDADLEPAEEEVEDEMDFDFDELDEEGMDELGESYLRRVYENVDSFKTSQISTSDNQLFIEGVINFKSGATKKTGFIFEAKDATKDGKVRFIGENAHFCRGKKAFTLTGSLVEKKLMVESFTYNYRAKNGEGKSTRIYGTVSRNK